MNSLSIPAHDAADFAQLPDAVKHEVRAYLRELHLLLNPELIHQVDTAAPTRRIGDAIARSARILGVSEKTMRRKYDDYRKTRDWRVLVNKSKCPANCQAGAALPAEFVEFWKSLCERNQRKCKPAYRDLLRRWNRGEAIPGYPTPPCANGSGIPHGWNYRTLIRHAPTKFELKAARQGRSAAAAHRPLVFTTRVGLSVGQYYLFDDLWHDFKVNVLGQRSAQRLLQFHALDLFSGCNFARGLKPALENDETGTTERLKEREMIFLVACVLSVDGFRKDGTILVVEHGTAAIREDLERKIFDLTGGAVRVERSGMEGASAFAGQYLGRGKGNFRFKAALESLGNLIHNETADTLTIPGQTGSNSRLNCPEELYGRDRYNDQLLRAIVSMPPERAAHLRLPFLEYNEAARLVHEIHQRINERTEHDLEGWLEAGLVANEIQIYDRWIDQQSLVAASLRDASSESLPLLTELVAAGKVPIRTRKLSPWEVWNRGRNNLLRMPACNVPQLLGPNLGVERRVRSQMFEFCDRALGQGDFRYLAKVRNRFGAEELLRDGETYFTHINPLNTAELHVSDARGRYLGTCARWQSVSRADAEALHRQCGAAAKVEAELLAPVARRGAAITRDRIATHRHNARVLDGKPISLAERMQRIEEKKRVTGINDFLPSDPGLGSAGCQPADSGSLPESYSLSGAELDGAPTPLVAVDESESISAPDPFSASPARTIASAEDFL